MTRGFIRSPTPTAAAAGGVAGGLLVLLASQSGGYFPPARLLAGAIAFAALAVLLGLRPSRARMSAPALLALGSLCWLTAWTGLSSLWSSAPDVALDDFQRNLLYVGLLGLGLLCAGNGRLSRHLVWMVLAIAVGTVAVGLAARLFPSGPVDPYEAVAQYRLSAPLDYWNALGAVGAMAVVLGVGLAADLRSHPVLRGAAAGGAVIAAVAAYMTFSRGAWLAFFVGLGVLVLVAPRRLPLLLSASICGLAAAVAVARLQQFEALTGDPSLGAGREAEGRDFALLLAVVVAVAATAQGLVARVSFAYRNMEHLTWLGRRAAAGAGALVVLAAGVLYLADAGRAEQGAASRLESADRWISTQWRDFMNPATFSATGTERLGSASGTRSDLFRVAIDGFEDDPLLGDGAGGFEARFAHDRRVPETVREPHSLYLDTLGELGAIGAAGLVALIGAFGWAAVVARRRARWVTRTQAAAASAALSVWAAHSAMDWDWQVPALTGLALLLAAALMAAGPPRRRRGTGEGSA